jgi:hypothetical protein
MAKTDSVDPFGQAPPASGGAFVRLHQLASGADTVTREYASDDEARHQTVKTSGRLVLITPIKAEQVPAMDPSKGLVTRWTVNVVVLNGETITVSVNDNTKEEFELPEPVVPNTKEALIEGMFVTSVMLGDQLRQAQEAKIPMLLGRIGRLKARGGQNPPYVLCEYTEEERVLARDYLAKYQNPYAG